MASILKRAYPTLVRAHVRGSAIDPAVADAIKQYLAARPAVRAHEAAEHGFDPYTDPARYLASELTEPEHASLRSTARFSLADAKEWMRQEDAQYEHPHENSGVQKEQPAAGDVHIDTASGDISVGYDPVTGKKRRKRKVSVMKADDEQRLVYGVVLEPDVEDSQGDLVSKEDVELAAHRFLYEGAPIGDQHRRLAPVSVRPVESYVAPCDFELGGEPVKKGSWVLVTHVPDDDLWEQVKKGFKAGYSVAGTGRRTPV